MEPNDLISLLKALIMYPRYDFIVHRNGRIAYFNASVIYS